jgi:DNA-binding NtrC family response regulator
VGEPVGTLEKLRLERDLYWRLLELGTREDLGKVLEEALALIVEVTSARRGYLALHPGDDEDAPRWWFARGFSDEDLKGVREAISRGIIAKAIATGETIVSGSALEDPRFQEHESVQAHKIQAVLCAPIGGARPIGVLYLQDHEPPGPFTAEDMQRAEAFARHLAPVVDRLRGQDDKAEDATLPFRRRLCLKNLVGRSRELAEVFVQVESAARFDLPVLLTGASGTGKTAFARAIHANSPRETYPFVELNCAAIPEGLFESELFGAQPGAHSTATRKMPGKISAAQGGTLFLDEIGEMSLAAQVSLLRVLQDGEFTRVGGNEVIKTDVRVIAATNKDLEKEIEEGRFRRDLFYRLNVYPVVLPALRERTEDIEQLVAYFIERFQQKSGRRVTGISDRALHILKSYPWPGNVRELENCMERAVIVAAGRMITEKDLPEAIRAHSSPDQISNVELIIPISMDEVERIMITKTLVYTNGDKAKAARLLNIGRKTLYRKLEQYKKQ